MVKVSILIPSRNEIFLQKTVSDLISKAEGDIEIVVVLDGYWPTPPLKEDKRLKIIHRGAPRGLRNGINSGVAIASGEYIMKTDAHCMFDQGYDKKLMADCDKDWVVIPRRYSLDAELWQVKDKPPIDYMYLSYPDDPQDFGGAGYHGREWPQKNRDANLKDVLVDDLMSFQGSCWFMRKDYFRYLELMDEDKWKAFYQEAQEIGLKCWFSGGRVVINKKTWYAHLHKGKQYGRGYFLDKKCLTPAVEYTNKFVTDNDWHKTIHDIRWLVKRFWPVPGWPGEYGR